MAEVLIPIKQARKIFFEAVYNYRFGFGAKKLETFLKSHPELAETSQILCYLGLLYDHSALRQRSTTKKKIDEKKALQLYESALKINPDSESAVWGIGRIWWHRKNAKAVRFAIQAYRIRKAKKKAAGEYAQNVGLAYEGIEKLKLAESWLIKGTRETPNSWGTHYNLLCFYIRHGAAKQKKRKAVIELEKLFREMPKKTQKTKWGETINRVIKTVMDGRRNKNRGSPRG